MNVTGNSWSFRCRRSLEDYLRFFNYFRWFWVRIRSCVNGSESQNVVLQQGSLTLLVTFIVVDVVLEAGLLVESYVKPR